MNNQPIACAPAPAQRPVQDVETRAYALIVRMFRQPSEVLRSLLAQDLCRLLGVGLNADVPARRHEQLLAAKEAIEHDIRTGFLPDSETATTPQPMAPTDVDALLARHCTGKMAESMNLGELRSFVVAITADLYRQKHLLLSEYETALLSYLEAQKFHPSASHVPPDYRDGYNHAVHTIMDRVRTEGDLRAVSTHNAQSKERSVG